MANSIEDALEKAVKQVEVGEVTEGKGAEEPEELSTRVKILLARKKNQRRRKRQHLPKALR
jgi:hypothetical protein